MLHKIEKVGKNVDEALANAAKELGVDVSEIGHEVVQEVGKGLIGFLVGKEVTINAWLKKDEPKVAPKPVEKAEKPKVEKKPVKKAEAPAKKVEKKSAKPVEKKVEKVEKPAKSAKVEKTATTEKSEKASRAPRVNAPVTDEAMTAAREFLSELLNKMGIEHELKVQNIDNVINIEVSGEKMGLLIGKRGDTLDAVQYLTSLYVNKDKSGYTKLNIDTENYREKREETLIRLAKGLERRVVTNRKPITLEPMSPYERRIIHAALQGSNKIKTYSVGNEPNRKIVVTLA